VADDEQQIRNWKINLAKRKRALLLWETIHNHAGEIQRYLLDVTDTHPNCVCAPVRDAKERLRFIVTNPDKATYRYGDVQMQMRELNYNTLCILVFAADRLGLPYQVAA